MKIKLIKKGNQLEKFIRKVQKLDDQDVKVGWFVEQGKHGPSGYLFPQLVAIHHNGINVPKRPILSIVANLEGPSKNSRDIRAILRNFFNNIETSIPSSVLEGLGEYYVRIIKRYFGSSYLSPTSTNPDPLVDTGELKRNTAYKTSITNSVKKVSK